jgi:hypothetical protein
LSSGKLLLEGAVGGGSPAPTGAPGTFNYYLGNVKGDIFVRIWDAKNISGKVDGRNYCTVGPFTMPLSPSAPPVFELPASYTSYVCAPPPPVGIQIDNLSVEAAAGKTKVSLTVSAVLNANSNIELARNPEKFWFRFRSLNSPVWERNYQSSGRLAIKNDSYFKPGFAYEAAAEANNFFGSSGLSDKSSVRFSIPQAEEEAPFENGSKPAEKTVAFQP